MKKLLIVESPAKIKTINKFLGKDFKIMSTVGHIKDLPQKKLGITMNGSIELEYVPIEDKDKVIAEINKAAKQASEIYLAPDPDREGEIIAWHVEQEIRDAVKGKVAIHRITFNEITEPAILQALQNPQEVDLAKVAAQQARRVLDRWVGYEVSPVLWKKIAPGLSAGRVQSVALRLICDRETAIRTFKPEEYWTITGLFGYHKEQFEAALTHIGKKKAEISNKKDAESTVKKIKESSFIVESVTDKERVKNPLPPFMTSTLQQAAFNRLGFSVKKTMQIAQKLYEGIPLDDPSTPVALITYMRTDSLRLSDTAIKQARTYIGKHFEKEYLPPKSIAYAKGKATTQDAHEAIRPINVSLTPDYVSKFIPRDAARLYELIWKRFVACQMKSALYAQRQVVLKGNEFSFKVTGSTLLFDGFLKVYAADEEEKEQKVVIPNGLKAKEPVSLEKVTPKQHFTQPPPKYTEASLVKEMEKEGIGRPSTYGTILSTIQARAYTTVDSKKRFTPTELGMTVTKMLSENLPQIMDIKFTAHMEEDLDKIAQGKLKRDVCLKEFYRMFEQAVKEFKGGDNKRIAEPTEVTCPECKKAKLAIRFGKTGEFLGCLNYPECSFTSNFKRNEQGDIELVKTEGPKILDEKCPECSKPLRQVIGKFGPFIACSGYPECKYIHQKKASFKCPTCKKGDVVERRWRGGVFWGCNNYPKCKFAVFGDIEETACPECKLPFLVKKTDKQGNITLFCSDKKCGYKKQ
jgi:DNA topoisomerase I